MQVLSEKKKTETNASKGIEASSTSKEMSDVAEDNCYRVCRVECTDNEIHLILKDIEIHECASSGEDFDEAAAIKKIMKEEALKPLFLMRDE